MRSRVPAPLAALLVVVGLFGVTWALLTPAGQVPDEESHIGYVQSVAARHELPGSGRDPFSTEQRVAMAAAGGHIQGDPERKPAWDRKYFDQWRATASHLPQDDGGGYLVQDDNPPLYYGYESIAYWTVGGHFFDRLYAMRLWSVLLLLVTTTGAWLLAGELFGRNRVLQLGAGAVAGLQPMVTFMSAGVNPDAMLFAFWSLAFWLGVRILRRGLTVRDGVALGVVVGLAFTEKAPSWALMPAALVAVGFGWRRLRARGAAGVTAAVVSAALAFAVPAGAWIVTAKALGHPVVNRAPARPGRPAPSPTSIHTLREFGSYVWQFYLPRPSFLAPFPGAGDGGERPFDTWVTKGWATFGWLEVRFPPWVYRLLAAISTFAIVGGLTALIRAGVRRRVDVAVVAFVGIAVVGLLAIVHWADYNLILVDGRVVVQGRYMLPLIALGGAAVAATVSLLPRRWHAPAVAVVLAGLLSLQLASLGLMIGRYFA